jgi:parvulin-like peptidyl-prolyl isomerase
MTNILLALWLAAPIAETTLVERIVAQVNGEIITQTEVQEREQSMINDLYRQNLPQEQLERMLAEAKAGLLRDIIHERLLLQKAEALAIEVTADQIDEVIDSIMKANNIADTRELEMRLSSEGLTMDKLRQNIETRMLIEKVRQFEVASRIVVTDEEVDRYYSEHTEEFLEPASIRLREIVLLTADREKQDVLREIQEIAALVHNGADFAELATLFSQAPSADHGGDMGMVDVATLSPEIRQASAALKPGETSEPVETRYGYHLLKLEERRDKEQRPLEEIRSEVRERLQLMHLEEALDEYMRELRQRAYIKIFPVPPGAIAYEVPPDFTED